MTEKEEYDRETAILYEQWEKENEEKKKKRIKKLRESFSPKIKEELRKKEKKEVEKLTKKLWKSCQICGFESKTYDEAETHYLEDHSKRYGANFKEFLSAFVRTVQKIRKELDQKADQIIEEDLKKEVFHRSLIEGSQKTRDDLSKMTIVFAQKAYEELCHEWDTQQRCSLCKQSVPFAKEIDARTEDVLAWDYSVRDHINTMIKKGDTEHTELAKYFNKMRALSQGKNPYKESEQLSTKKDKVDIALMKSTTESSTETKEELTKSNLPDKNLLKIFSEEVCTELSKKKKKHKLARKTR